MTTSKEESPNDGSAAGIKFYRNLLLHKNPSNELYPIVRLIGHRGQASKKVRDIAVTPKDLKDFFNRNPAVFTVSQDHVQLSNSNASPAQTTSSASNGIVPTKVQNLNIIHPPRDNIDMNLINAVAFYYGILRTKSSGVFPLVSLMGYKGSASPEIQRAAKKARDLKTSFEKFPNVFVVDNINVTVKNSVIIFHDSLTFYLKKLLELTPNNNTFSKLILSRDSAPPHVKTFINNCAELEIFFSGFSDIFQIRDNFITIKSVFASKIVNENLEKSIYSNALNVILKQEYYRYNMPLRSASSNIDRIEENTPSLTLESAIAPLTSSSPNISSVNNNTLCLPDPSPSHSASGCNNVNQPSSPNTPAAVQFFLEKLWQFGPWRVISLSELFKFKSEAPRDIQMVCGNSIAEFKTFLCQNPESFIVTCDNVLAKRNVPRKQWCPTPKGIEEPALSMMVNFFKSFTQHGKPESIDKLYSMVGNCFQTQDGKKFFENSKELKGFLDMFPHIFYTLNNHVVNLMYSDENCINEFKKDGSRSKKNASNKTEPNNNVGGIKHFDENFLLKWKEDVLKKTEVVDSVGICRAIVLKILGSDRVIALDCEARDLGVTGSLSLIQIARENGEVYIFDIKSQPELIVSGNLKAIIESDNILKVIHDCRNDSANLFYEYGVRLNKVFDTRVAHAFINNPNVKKRFEPIALNKLCDLYGVPTNVEKDDMRDVYKTNPSYWLARPLTSEMKAYAALDVACLVPNLYYKMREKLGNLEPKVYDLSHRYSLSSI